MSDELIQPEKKVGIGAYISLIFACVFFSGAFASNHWWGIFDFITLNGTWGKVVQNVTMNDAGALQTVLGNFRGKGGSGAIDGFCFALTLIPTIMFSIAMVTVCEYYGALEAARKLLTPILRGLLGIPGSACLALIASLQSSDGGAAMTRQLKDEGKLTEKEVTIFATFQQTAGAGIGSFLASGAVLFTLMGPDGKPLLPIALGVGLGIELLGKVVAAWIMRIILFRAGKNKNRKRKMAEENMATAVQPERKEIVTEVFVRGAKKGWGIAIGSMLPNVVMAFVIIKALNITGILTLVGDTCGPVMEIFGLPGEAIVVLLGAWLSAGGGVGTAIALHSSGALNGTDLAILTPAIFLMGSQVQYLGRVLGVIGVSGRMVPIIMAVPVIVAILSLWVMRLIVLAS